MCALSFLPLDVNLGEHRLRGGSGRLCFWLRCALPKLRIGEEAMSTPLHRLSSGPGSDGRAAALLKVGSGLGEQHHDRGADVAGQEDTEQRRGERKAVLEREHLGGVGGAKELGHSRVPSCDRLPFRSVVRLVLWCSAGCALAHLSETGPKCNVRIRPPRRSEAVRQRTKDKAADPLDRSTWPIKCTRHDSLASARC